MKSLEELARQHGEFVAHDHSLDHIIPVKDDYIFTLEQLESLINEVISQRAGEPVGEIADSSHFIIDRSGKQMRVDEKGIDYYPEDLEKASVGDKVYLAADPSVIEYVKTLRNALNGYVGVVRSVNDENDFHVRVADAGKPARDAFSNPPDSIKHLLD